MKNLNYYKEKIKEKRKQTSFRDYLKEIVFYFPMTYYKNSSVISVSDLDNFEAFDSSWNWKINSEILKKIIKDWTAP